jgi:hypothetical protein
VVEEIDRHVQSVSRSFVKLFLREVWKPFAKADMPAERWPAVEEGVERLSPLASEALMAIFQQRLGREIQAAFDEIARRLAERKRK